MVDVKLKLTFSTFPYVKVGTPFYVYAHPTPNRPLDCIAVALRDTETGKIVMCKYLKWEKDRLGNYYAVFSCIAPYSSAWDILWGTFRTRTNCKIVKNVFGGRVIAVPSSNWSLYPNTGTLCKSQRINVSKGTVSVGEKFIVKCLSMHGVPCVFPKYPSGYLSCRFIGWEEDNAVFECKANKAGAIRLSCGCFTNNFSGVKDCISDSYVTLNVASKSGKVISTNSGSSAGSVSVDTSNIKKQLQEIQKLQQEIANMQNQAVSMPVSTITPTATTAVSVGSTSSVDAKGSLLDNKMLLYGGIGLIALLALMRRGE